VDAVKGVDQDIDELVKQGKVTPEWGEDKSSRRKSQIGLSLSNFKVYNLIKATGNMDSFSIILEDDFEIIIDNYQDTFDKIIDSVHNVDFDLLYLQNNFQGHPGADVKKNHGEQLKDNVYYMNKNDGLIGTVAIIVNNRSIDKIIDVLTPIYTVIDHTFEWEAKADRLNILTVYPTIIEQKKGISTTIA